MERIPERKLPEFKISKEQAERLRTVSAITKILADDPELTKNIANEFVKAASSRDPIPANIVMREKISRMIVEKVKDLSVERVTELYPYWCRYFVRYWIPHIHYWDYEYYIGPRTEQRI
ncbi:MAG: hypothetical protein H3Z49_05665 [archaeon]|nr:hypothetical protein [archaeon]